MRVLVEVVGQPLNLRGPHYHVGERLFLDTTNPQHQEVLAAGWVRRVEGATPTQTAAATTAAVSAPPVDRMVRAAGTKAAGLPPKPQPRAPKAQPSPTPKAASGQEA